MIYDERFVTIWLMRNCMGLVVHRLTAMDGFRLAGPVTMGGDRDSKKLYLHCLQLFDGNVSVIDAQRSAENQGCLNTTTSASASARCHVSTSACLDVCESEQLSLCDLCHYIIESAGSQVCTH